MTAAVLADDVMSSPGSAAFFLQHVHLGSSGSRYFDHKLTKTPAPRAAKNSMIGTSIYFLEGVSVAQGSGARPARDHVLFKPHHEARRLGLQVHEQKAVRLIAHGFLVHLQ